MHSPCMANSLVASALGVEAERLSPIGLASILLASPRTENRAYYYLTARIFTVRMI